MTTSDLGAAAPTAEPRRLYRRSDDKVLAGVCAALGRYTDIDPVIYRIVLVVLAVFGGAGVVLYGVGWALIPDQTGRAPADGLLHGRGGRLFTKSTLGVVIIAVAILILLGSEPTRPGALLALIALGGFLLLRERRQPAAVAGGGSRMLGTPEDATLALPLPPRERRPMSPVGPVTLLAAVVGSVLTALFGGTLVAALAVALVALAVGLSVAFLRRAGRWLVLPGLLVAGALAVAVPLGGIPLGEGSGDRAWAPASDADVHSTYRLGAGDALLDLSAVSDLAQGRTIRVMVGAGRLRVQLPAALNASVRARAAAGTVIVLGRETDGMRAEIESGGRDAALHLDVRVGYGQVKVLR